MRVVVTGAAGFVGRELVRRLVQGEPTLPLTALVAMDQRLDPSRDPWLADPRVQGLEGDFADPALLDRAFDPLPQIVIHLASVPGSLAEHEPELGLRVNLHGAFSFLLRLAAAGQRGVVPRVVFASSVAVYGPLGDQPVDESRAPCPELSYGAHKLMTEILLADLSRRGALDAISLRLPGIVARPPSPTGHGSAFMSDLFHAVAAGAPSVCPVGADATCWWMSLATCIDNFLHAATLPATTLPTRRVVQLPVLSARVRDVVAAIESVHVSKARLHYAPDPAIERHFGRYPSLLTPAARALGFVDDATLVDLARRARAM
ncbi:MAG: NAD-dependent epimerase/dehydratase family protein [Rubrivivax sp.]